jgi:UDP-N-acetylmuramoyl-tripeptide--D-alanyl-D-alanine ligase
MLNLTLSQITTWLNLAQLVGPADTVISQVSTDTRTIKAGDLYVALCGERFDGHAFVAQAAQKGAAAALVSQLQSDVTLPQIVVPDTRLALGQLAKAWRQQFSFPLIVVTGSNGKTTVTQMIAAILEAAYPQAYLSTQGNLNNDIGVPLTLLRLRANHQSAVVELGMNHPGEIGYLTAISQPTIALVNNAQREHLEFMKSVENVAHENGACLLGLPDDGVAVFPADDDYTALWNSMAKPRQCIHFSSGSQAQVYPISATWSDNQWQINAHTPQGACQFTLAVAGRHNVKNAMAALACAAAAGISPAIAAQGLTAFSPVKGRSRSMRLNWGGQQLAVVDDTYNANPDSMRAAVDVLSELPGPTLLVVGDMGEVGDQGPSFHHELGLYAKQKGIQHLMCTGELTQHSHQAFGSGQHFNTMDALCAAVIQHAHLYASILVKGSRFMKISALQESAHPRKDTSDVA